MKVNVANPVLDFKNEPVMDEKNEPISYRDVIFNALNNFAQGENPTPDEKQKSFSICSRLFTNDEVDLTVEEAAYIKDRSGKVSMPLVYGRICELFES